MSQTALIVVDVQNDFCEGGSLAVEGGAAVAARISRHLRQYHDEYGLVVASRDFHPPHLPDHFGNPPDYLDTWPAHCVAGTPGSEYHDDFSTTFVNEHIEKGQHSAAYSAFEGMDASEFTLHELLHRVGITRVEICGIATDYCVKATALDAVANGYATTVLMDLTAAVGGEEGKQAMRELFIENGIGVEDVIS